MKRRKTMNNKVIPGLRDFIAISALSCLSNPDYNGMTAAYIARYCYGIADAMLIERENPSAITK